MSENRTRSNHPPVTLVNPGDPIRARWLSNVARTVNDHSEALRPPQSLAPVSNDSQAYESDDQIPSAQLGSELFTETGRQTSTVRITDPSDSSVYVDVSRIDAVTFSSGARTLTLSFNNG